MWSVRTVNPEPVNWLSDYFTYKFFTGGYVKEPTHLCMVSASQLYSTSINPPTSDPHCHQSALHPSCLLQLSGTNYSCTWQLRPDVHGVNLVLQFIGRSQCITTAHAQKCDMFV